VSLVAVAAGKDSRGVTTTAVALAAVWPRPRPLLLAECDPSGGSLAARYGMPSAPGLITLASAGRRQLLSADIAAHAQVLPSGDLNVLVGAARAEEAHALGHLWSGLAAALAEFDGDVIADCGRLDPDPPVEPILRHADVVLLVCEPTREGVLHLQGRLQALGQRGLTPVVILLGEEPYSAREVQQALDQPAGSAEVLGVIARDAEAAGLLAGRPGSTRKLTRSLLIRSARGVASELERRLASVEPWARDVASPAAEPAVWAAEVEPQ
jgi:MinD-like ATPase involved in chromosome partitioning or flagellar assembly